VNTKDWLQAAIDEELSNNNPLLPPWIRHPELERGSLGWRMGYGESYMMVWWKWIEQFNQDELLEYFKQQIPIPLPWQDWVACYFEQDEDEVFIEEKWLAKQGLIDFEAYIKWYEEYWGTE
jgi:hypothetical protein